MEQYVNCSGLNITECILSPQSKHIFRRVKTIQFKQNIAKSVFHTIKIRALGEPRGVFVQWYWQL